METKVTDPYFCSKLNTTYQTVYVTSGATTYSFMRAKGKVNYVSVLKESNNPFKTLGKEYPDFDAAQVAYKMPTVKNMILIAESLLK